MILLNDPIKSSFILNYSTLVIASLFSIFLFLVLSFSVFSSLCLFVHLFYCQVLLLWCPLEIQLWGKSASCFAFWSLDAFSHRNLFSITMRRALRRLNFQLILRVQRIVTVAFFSRTAISCEQQIASWR